MHVVAVLWRCSAPQAVQQREPWTAQRPEEKAEYPGLVEMRQSRLLRRLAAVWQPLRLPFAPHLPSSVPGLPIRYTRHNRRCCCCLQSNVMDKKRRGGPLDGIPEAKRPTRTASARSDRSAAPAPASRGNSSSAGAGRAGAAGRGGAAAAGAAAAAPEAAPKVEETWEDIAERTGLSADDVLNRCACLFVACSSHS